MFNKVIVANRGAVAARVLRALYEMGIKSVAVYSEADYGAPYLEMASETYAIGASPALESYLNQDTLLAVLKKSGADGVHPGYGFLSENAGFAQRVTDSGICFIGPSPKWIEAMGHKTRARDIAAEHGMPMSKGTDVLPAEPERILAAARGIGEAALVSALATAGLIGAVVAERASLSGAEGGCQAETGAAAGMAAGAATEMLGGSPSQVGHAVALAQQGTLGLVCDPLGGLVELPCVFRNATGAAIAMAAIEMALAGVTFAIPADEVIDVMGDIGREMDVRYRETAGGGLAATPTGRRLARERLVQIKRS